MLSTSSKIEQTTGKHTRSILLTAYYSLFEMLLVSPPALRRTQVLPVLFEYAQLTAYDADDYRWHTTTTTQTHTTNECVLVGQ